MALGVDSPRPFVFSMTLREAIKVRLMDLFSRPQEQEHLLKLAQLEVGDEVVNSESGEHAKVLRISRREITYRVPSGQYTMPVKDFARLFRFPSSGYEEAQKFLNSRVAFIYIEGRLRAQNWTDARTTEAWACAEFDYTHGAWARSKRGYVMQGRIQFFTGEDYHTDMSVTSENVSEVQELYKYLYGSECDGIYNGVAKGHLGEMWLPLCKWAAVRGSWVACEFA